MSEDEKVYTEDEMEALLQEHGDQVYEDCTTENEEFSEQAYEDGFEEGESAGQDAQDEWWVDKLNPLLDMIDDTCENRCPTYAKKDGVRPSMKCSQEGCLFYDILIERQEI